MQEREADQRRGNERLFVELLRAMDSTDIPRARPIFARENESTGLTLLSMALRLDHVTRVTENLRLINTDHMSRTVSVDVDLRNLTTREREALTLRESPIGQPVQWDGGQEHRRMAAPDRLWVPISRHSREDLAPVVVRDGDGSVVPRLTQLSATDAVVAGVTRLFRMQLAVEAAPPGAAREDVHRARWLIEAAIAQLIEHGIHGKPERSGREGPGDSQIRRIAQDYLLTMPSHQARHYAEVLRAASLEYFLVVMLSGDRSQQFLTYEAPLIPAVRSSSARARAWRALLPFSTEFTVDYVTQIPRAVGSYHVTVEVPEEIDVRRFILSSNTDELVVDDLAGRIEAVTSRTDRELAVVTAEARDVEAMLGELGKRRQLDVEGFDYYLQNRELLGHRAGDRQRRRDDGQTDGVAGLRRLQGVGADRRADPKETQLGPLSLAGIGRWIRQFELGRDVSTDNDPRENGAHAQWRPVPLSFGHPTVEPIKAELYLALADEPPALVESVARMVGALVLVVVGVFLAAATGSGAIGNWAATRIPQSDAAVAVLLVVPGILLTRLDINSTHSVLGRLRRFPQLVAYLSVAVTTGLAMVIAGANDEGVVYLTAFPVSAGLLTLLLMLCYLEKYFRQRRRGVLVPAVATIPVWLQAEFGLGHRAASALKVGLSRRVGRPDVYFDAIKPVPNTPRVATRRQEADETDRRRGRGTGPLGTPEGPALLADLAARAVQYDYTMSEVRVSHSDGHIPDDLLDADFDELLLTIGQGSAFQITVKSLSDHHLHNAVGLSLETAGSCRSGQGTPARWSGRRRLPPVSIRNYSYDLDLLAEFPDPSPPPGQPQPLLTFLHTCLRDAPDIIVPTLVNGPTSPANPLAATNLRLASANALRMTWSVPYGRHSDRLDFESDVVRNARDHGVRLWRATRRPDAGQGDWELLYDEAKSIVGSTGCPQPSALVPVTFVGERGEVGVSSFRTLVDVLKDEHPGVASLTACVIGQSAVVHLLAERRDGRPRKSLAREPLPMGQAFEEMARCGLIEPPSAEVRRTLAGIKFTALIGAPKGTGRTPPRDEMEESLWVDWELPVGRMGQRNLAELILRKVGETIGPGSVLFWRARVGSDERVRGRAKLSVRRREDAGLNAMGFGIGDQAKAVQSQLITELAQAGQHIPTHSIYVHVVWSEPWLSRRRGI